MIRTLPGLFGLTLAFATAHADPKPAVPAPRELAPEDAKAIQDLEFKYFVSDGLGNFTEALKFGVNRTRPTGSSHSFPSGHASASFATG